MASYEELFAIGERFEAFIAHGLPDEIAGARTIQARLAEPGVIGDTTRQRIGRIERRYHLLVAGEMWCPDCQINVTVLDYLQRTQPRIDMAIITKGRAEDDLRERLELERIPIPVVAVLDERFQLVGRFIERPQVVVAGGDALKPDYRAGLYLESTLTDLLDILEAAEGRA
ncbi:thioredoxin family protein [Pseudomonas sp. ZM23]|uniref:Thioredoxin family protein n=1 Tax=Pseudomonas triclosanedens TaxID=2961893 RepID=A0ABY6ZS18_9PSED|nr:thioredoxin family protein [Pseudomonas triclosanedens]MCP8467102.1 thioredoxin family protein [Pseudomonas triclosanedens]MCP8472749.1 thioredoxin family protein [Pseudomonas triclosanedens]MCP8478180.1 thioredoxin family protein [Pseudomonas triclosanedens]WAI47586.1 thioredoxin family protein [Pseudomonas triclosanedens]